MKHTNLLLLSSLLGFSSHAFAQAGEVVCWGSNYPNTCAGSGVFTQVACGWHHDIGLWEDGTIACWGANFYGQCDAPDGVFTQVAGGGSHSLFIRVSCTEDISNNGIVDYSDLITVISNWGPCDTDCPADIVADGVVGYQDLVQVLSAWGPCE